MKKIYTLLLALMISGLGFGQVFITEIADPDNSAGSRYVELYNAGGTSVDLSTWALRRWTNANAAPQSDVALSGTIPAGGFIIFAANSATFSATFASFSGTVIQLGTGGPVDSNGDDNIALIDNTSSIVDIFGVPGEDGTGTCHEFEDGRAERAASVTSGNATWDEAEWNVWADSAIAGCTNHTLGAQSAPADYDPGEWIGAAPPSSDTEVAFIGTSASVSEGDGIFELEFTILNESATTATSFDVVLTVGDAADVDSYTTQTVTFPAGSTADQTVTVTITDDATFENDETLTFEIQNVTGGTNAAVGAFNTFDLTITNNDAPPTIALPYTEDFSDCNAAQWVAYDQSGANSWTCGSGQFTMNGFPNPDDVDWLISNFSIDFDLTSNENIAVTTNERFGDAVNDPGEFELRYSTDYAGFGDPTLATWTALTFDPNNTSTGGTPSADTVTVVDASGITGTAYLAFFYDTAAGSGAEEWNITEILIQEGALPTEVNFIGATASVAEDSGTYDLEFTILNEDAINPTSFDVVLTVGDAADINAYTTQTVTFPAGSTADQTVTITITDDAIEETDETLTFEIQNVTGGNAAAVGANSTFDLTILANDEPVLPGTLYDADFSNDGDGFPAHNSSSPPAAGPAQVGPFGTAPNAWFLSYDTTPGTDGSDNIFEVIAGELVSDDWGGQGIFTSQVIDVTGISVVDITATGVNVGANDDNFTYFYILDGGSRVETPVSSTNGDPVNYSVLSLDVSGATSLEVGFEFSENGGGDGYNVSEFLVVEGSADTSVQFTSTSDTVIENAGTYDLTFEITFEDAINPTSFDVVLTAGDAADIDSYTTQTVTFPAGSAANQTVTVTITDDALVEPIETLTFEIQNVTGGNNAAVGINNTFNLDIQDNDGGVPLPGDIVISEIMYNTPSTDDEWVELYNGSGSDITLDTNWRLSYNGNTFDFAGTVITAGSYLTVALGSNGDGTYNNDNPFTPDVSAIATPVATTNDTNNLGNTSATIEVIYDPSGANITIDTVTYDDGAPWPSAADGDGPSLELIDVTFDNTDGANWVASGFYNGGTPGAAYVAPVTYTFNGTWSPNDPNGTATASDDIVIESGDAVIISNTTCNSVTVNPGAGLTVNTGVTLEATNGLTLESTSTSYSSLILDGSVTGTLSYERHVNINGTGSTGSNDLVSAPLTGQAFSDFAAANPNLFDNGAGTLFLFGPFDKTTGDFVTYADTEAATLDASIGYRAATDDNGSLTFTGAAENGTVNNNILNSGPVRQEWNLVGNPYPSYLNVQDFLTHEVDTGVTNLNLFDAPSAAIYGYDGSATNGWTIYNLATTTPSTVIAPGQGFFVSADAANVAAYDLEFTPAMRSTGNTDDFIVGRNAELKYLVLNLASGNKSNNTEFYFNSNATQGFDLGYDAEVWSGVASEFAVYSHLVQANNGESMALQALNISDLSDVTIPLGVNANAGEQITFSIADTTLPSSVNVYLEDVATNTVTLLNNSDYVMTPNANLSGTGRFYLRYSEDALSTIENSIDKLNIFALNSSDQIVVSGQLFENTNLDLYDIQGRKVLSTKLDESLLQNRIDVSNINSGVYLVTVQNSNHSITKKVILK
ncbi:lamin tail domain-containing protein [Psychroserpens sp. XS_ASV72]|uniref:lamin tail domain-containing protein n=1 Tax=Psychroserpens sp. XS_ASV72 TaxID=3241293 RepID=UPI003513B3DB